ncbi:hypothetical protein IW139_001131 [Coemansia sp. RSA 353]|nr:hypothetical protein LPJ58_002523 [Coemansia sp. RSA 1591]KAJ1763446.1 hypothetical protein LPJ69_002472 [Coemansia sp. RSA 1752]KAJ1776928.1 hypothetical protein LPJ54_002751 [Coemansia sp. RSA 1824]KAJ1789661.1 hypothetical protein LPJ67_002418 [Coemansia sp. RSA 1938]KAJ2144941.1 hypothetical protein IW142_002864 [Coemansia sp. RSA 564]KAJ2190773.1 hypothetical protein EV181_000808 [Coemansia sp. RSA 532]KAJ2256518.1 hypothetical protein GGH98_001463 [Coemansia sp. RSA 454]KAJ2267819.1
MYMAYRKRSLDLPVLAGQAQGAKHARSGGSALPPIRSLGEVTDTPRLPSLLVPTPLTGDPSVSLAAIRVSSPNANPSSAQHTHETIKVARNWSRDETLSLVRAIGRHYESLKRCKTNQERSNVWHRIHKEHSSQFPGRSKKASQDRWGKVLSDYKDVMVHNKEKGAARWTFDFFKEVAAIVESDSQFMELATSPRQGLSPNSADDLGAYSFGATSRIPPNIHRMSEPSLHVTHPNHSYSMVRSQPALQMSPVELHGPSRVSCTPENAHDASGSVSAGPRYSPSRRTSFPQMMQTAPIHGSAAPAYARAPVMGAESRGFGYQRHSIQVLSPHPGSVTSSLPFSRTPNVDPVVRPSPNDTEPERACRYVLDMLEAQVRRIDAQQDTLTQLRTSTRDAISQVEHVLQRYTRPQ